MVLKKLNHDYAGPLKTSGLGVDKDAHVGGTLYASNVVVNGVPIGTPFTAGKNKLINGDFFLWSRGTSFLNPTSLSYLADRWYQTYDGTGQSVLITQQGFTYGNAIPGYEPAYYLRLSCTASGTGGTYNGIAQRIEDVRTFAGQTVNISFWARGDYSRSISVYLNQNFGVASLASTTVTNAIASPIYTTTTGWTLFTYSATLPSISGKYIGVGSFLEVVISLSPNIVQTIDLWGVQLESGSNDTEFTTSGGSFATDSSIAQRYYWRAGGSNAIERFGMGYATSATNVNILVPLKSTMRVAPTSVDANSLSVYDGVTVTAVTAVALNYSSPNTVEISCTLASGGTTLRPYVLIANSTSSYLGFSAEL